MRGDRAALIGQASLGGTWVVGIDRLPRRPGSCVLAIADGPAPDSIVPSSSAIATAVRPSDIVPASPDRFAAAALTATAPTMAGSSPCRMAAYAGSTPRATRIGTRSTSGACSRSMAASRSGRALRVIVSRTSRGAGRARNKVQERRADGDAEAEADGQEEDLGGVHRSIRIDPGWAARIVSLSVAATTRGVNLTIGREPERSDGGSADARATTQPARGARSGW